MRIENEMTSKSVMNEFAERIKQYRINMRITQAELSKRTGISIRNIVRIEKGEDTQFNNIIKILSVLHLQNNLDLVIPDNSLRPTNIVDLKNKKNRSRVSKIKNDKEKKFAWGDSKIN
jgi:transcriptional regulator with XRE-family HTH domain